MWGRKECIGCSRSQEDVHPRLPLDGTWTASRADTRETDPPSYIIILFHFAQSLKYNWFSVGRGREDMVIMHKSGENMTKDISSASFFDERLQKSIVFLLNGCIRTRSTWPQSAGDQQGVQYSYDWVFLQNESIIFAHSSQNLGANTRVMEVPSLAFTQSNDRNETIIW